MTNIGRDYSIYTTQSVIGGNVTPYKYTKPDLNGYTTNDILSSDSSFRRGYSSDIKTLKLGVKYKKYTNFMPNKGIFSSVFSSNSNPPGLSNFVNDGWIFSDMGASSSYAGISSSIIEAGITSPELKVSGINLNGIENVIDNINTANIETKRYSMVELEISDFNLGTYPGAAQIFTDYIKATYSLTPEYLEYTNTSSSVKKEFFYNKNNLGLYNSLFTSVTTDVFVKYSYISFYEVDMIPFFRYATESNIDQAVYQPIIVNAPYIDYTNANYNYINNSGITLDMIRILNNNSVFTPQNSGNIFLTSASSV